MQLIVEFVPCGTTRGKELGSVQQKLGIWIEYFAMAL